VGKSANGQPGILPGDPEEVRSAIKTIAEDLDVNQEDVARAFLEFGLYCFHNKEIEIQGISKAGI
jgi:hypothetical protein